MILKLQQCIFESLSVSSHSIKHDTFTCPINCSERLADSIISGLPLPFLLLLVDFVNEADGANHISSIDIVTATVVDLLSDVRMLNLSCVSCQLLNELKGIDHLAQCLCPLLCNRHQCNQAGLQAVLQHKGRSLAPFQIKRDAPQSAHVEECLVLDARNACVLQMLHVHEASSLCVVLSSIALKRTEPA